MILNIFRPDSGSLRLFGGLAQGTRDARIGYLPEERGLYRRMKCGAALLLLGAADRRDPQARDRRLAHPAGPREWGGAQARGAQQGMSQKSSSLPR